MKKLGLLAVLVASTCFAAEPVVVPRDKEAPPILEGAALTSVVVTQCNLLVAVYFTMEDGRLVRFDSSSGVPFDQMLAAAHSAKISERVETQCEIKDSVVPGAKGFERKDSV